MMRRGSNRTKLLEFDADLLGEPSTPPQLVATAEKAKKKNSCYAAPVKRKGGHKRHDAYATKVSKSALDYFVQTPGKTTSLAINYDGQTPKTPVVWEAKVGYGWLYNVHMRWLVDKTLARFDEQKERGLKVAKACGYSHKWSVTNKHVSGFLNRRWGGNPIVHNVPE